MNGLGAAMRDVTEYVDVRAGFVGDVLRGGRRRQTARRRGIAVIVAAVVGLAGFSAGMVVRARADPQDVRLLEPTRGNLAADPNSLLIATEVWDQALTLSWTYDREVAELRDKPHVYWAGTTPVGDAAVVMQEAKVRNQWRTIAGLVARDPADGAPKLVGATNPIDPTATTESFQFGPGDRTFLVVDPSIPVHVSPKAIRNAEGVVRREWQQVPMTDGVGIWTAPEMSSPSTVRLMAGSVPPGPADRLLDTRPASAYLRYGLSAKRNGEPTYATGLWQTSPPTSLHVGPDGPRPPFDVDQVDLLKGAGLVDIGPRPDVGTWNIIGATADGRSLLVGEYMEAEEQNRLFAVLFRSDGTPDRVVRGPTVAHASRLQVAIRLPDDQGWVVATTSGSIDYRTEGGTWRETNHGWELLPDDTIQVRVNPYHLDQAPEVVDLPR